MQLRYDEDLIEAAVFVCTERRNSIPPAQIARFHRARERLYAILDPDDRNRAFFNLHMEWFEEWGLNGLLATLLEEFPLLEKSLEVLAFRKARGQRDEGAELYVNETGARTGVVALRPERLSNQQLSAAFLRHEFAHLQDMVDPAFGYVPELDLQGASANQQRLARERYRVLWAASIDGRHTSAGRPTIASREERWREFIAAFAFEPPAEQQAIFDFVWNDPNPRHRTLEQFVCDPRYLHPPSGPEPGGHCPLCGFPTFAWATPAALEPQIVSAIQVEFPHWLPEHGVCGRCRDMYRVKSAQNLIPV